MSIDRAELQDAARKAFGESGPAPDAEKSWSLISEMGWLMMAVPEDQGGLGLGREAEGVIHTELGRALVPGPAIAQMLTITALSAAEGLAERDDLLARAMGGEVMTASLSGGHAGNALSCIPDANKASHLLIATDQKITLVPLDGATLTPRDTWDKTRRLFDVALADTSTAYVLAEGAAAKALNEKLQSQLLLALAGDSLGGAEAILGLTIEYLNTRRQFDRPLALFQALKHRVADMKVRHAAAEALFWSRATNDATRAEMGALKALATNAYHMVVEEAVQLHGGIGLTSEYYCHIFLKRATLNNALGGDADYWEEQAGREVLAATNA